ncbi:MAG: transcriptional repressor [Candidatus Goldbacteria bacterium]|nr:transcriptional repressor [Candidatus Goldiibacteriota bacterium]
MDNTQMIKDELIKHNIKPSLIRIKVLEYLKSTKEHPNAEKIFKKLSKDIPTLSITSIYNALKLFVGKGVIKEIMIQEEEIRYDGANERHAHFKCIKCNKLYDLKLKCRSCLEVTDLNKVKILDEHIYLVGICKKCIKKETDL